MKTGEVKEYSMSWRDLDQFKKDNPDLQQIIIPVMICNIQIYLLLMS